MSNKFKWLVDGLFQTNGKATTSKNSIAKGQITEEVALNETSFKGFIENLPVMFYAVETTPPYKPIYLSPAFETLGFTKDDWLNNPGLWIQSIYDEDRDGVLVETEKLLKTGQPLDFEYRLKSKTGNLIWVRDRGVLIQNLKGKASLWQGVIIDITERKLAEAELLKREDLYRTISRNIPKTGIVIFDHDLRYTLAEGEQLESLDLTPKMLEGKTLFEVFPKDVADEISRYYRATLAGGFVSFERTIPEKDLTIQNYFIPLKNDKKEVYGGMSIWQDITEFKKRTEKLKESEERYRELFEGANDLIYVHDLKGNFLSMNKAAEKVFGYTHAEILKLNIIQVIAPEHLANASQMMAKKLTKDVKQTVYELECLAKDGRRVTLEVNSCVVYQDDTPLHIQGIARDVTERKVMQKALVENEERLRNLFENANDLIYVLDLTGTVISANKAIEKLFGYSNNELLKMNFLQIVAPDYLELAQQQMSSKLKGAKQTVFEIECLTKSGRRLTLEVNSCPMFLNGKMVAIQGIARDITERKLIEQKIQESEAELRALFGAMQEVVMVLDNNGRYLKIPPTNPSLLVKPPQDLIGKTIHEVFAKDQADFFLAKINEALTKQKSLNVDYCIEIQGQTHWFSSIISPMPNNCVVMVARDVSHHKNAEFALRASENKYRNLFENANDLIYTTDLQGNITSINKTGEKISGYSKKEASSGKVNFAQIVAPEYLERAKAELINKLAGKRFVPYQIEILTKKGSRVTLELSSRLIEQDGKPIGIQGIGRDISDRKKVEAALTNSESQYRFLSEGIMHQVWTAQPNGKIDYVNGRTLEYFNKTIQAMAQDNWMDVVHPEDLPETIEKWTNSLMTGELYDNEFRLRHHLGDYRWHRALATAGLDSNGKILKWFGTNTDIHDQKIAEDKLTHFAKHDTLTNLPNRVKFMSHLERVIKRAEFIPDFKFAVLFLDLDRFKLINDSLGHLIGDKLLISFAERLETCVRPGDIVARLGGDEFTILLNNLVEPDDAIRITNRLIQKLAEPFYLNDYEVFTSASIGIVVADDIAREPEDFLRDADTAMYRAKEAGKSRYEIFNSEMHVRNKTLLKVENDLRRAIERDEFRVVYQPIISLETGEICEFEALIRWQHPEYGLIEPVEFIKVAEETGLIVPIGNWIIKEASRQTADWQRRFPNSNPFAISINLSDKQLMHPPLVAQIKEVLAETGLNPQALRLEVTESVVMGNDEVALNVLNELSNIGVSLSTDDFGTGYSSLSYLHRFPFDSLKIDRSFIGQIDTDKKSSEIVRTILMLAQNLNLEAIAEGIETEEQLKQLQVLGCRFGQGYLFSKPINAVEIEQLLIEKSNGFKFTVPADIYQNIHQSTEIH